MSSVFIAPILGAMYTVNMTTTTTAARRRESLYPARLSVNLTQEQAADLEREAEREQIAVGVLLREAFTSGWPRVLDRRRKARRTRTRNDGGAGKA